MFRAGNASTGAPGGSGAGGELAYANGGHGAAFQHPDSFAHHASAAGPGEGMMKASTSSNSLGGGAAVGDESNASIQVGYHSTRRGHTAYPFRLNFYQTPPQQGSEITIEDFEKWALDRLRGESGALACWTYDMSRSGPTLDR